MCDADILKTDRPPLWLVWDSENEDVAEFTDYLEAVKQAEDWLQDNPDLVIHIMKTYEIIEMTKTISKVRV